MWKRSGSGSTRRRSSLATSPNHSIEDQSTGLRSVSSATKPSARSNESVPFSMESVNDVRIDRDQRRKRVNNEIVPDSELELSALSDHDIVYLFEALQAQNITDLSAKFWTKVDLAVRKIIDTKNANLAELFLRCSRLPSRHCLSLLENFPLIIAKIDEGDYSVVSVWHESARLAHKSNVSVDDAIRKNNPALVKAFILNGELCEENRLKLLVNFPQIAKEIMQETNDVYLQALCEFALIKDEYDAMTVEQVIATNDGGMARELVLFAPLKHEFIVNVLDKFPMLAQAITQDNLLSPELIKLSKSRVEKKSFLTRVGFGSHKTEHMVGATIDYTLHYLLASATNDEMLVQIALKHHSVRLAKYLFAQRETLDINLKFTLYTHFKEEFVACLNTPSDSKEHEHKHKVKRSSMRTVYPNEGKFSAYKDEPIEESPPSYKSVELDTTCSSKWVHKWQSPPQVLAEDNGGEGSPPPIAEPGLQDCKMELSGDDPLSLFKNQPTGVTVI